MNADKTIVLILCVTAAIGVILYEILRVRKEREGDYIIPLTAYDGYKIFYIIGIIFIAMAYNTRSPNHPIAWEYTCPAIIMFLGAKYGRRLDIYDAKLDNAHTRIDKHIQRINDYRRKS